MTTDTAAVVRTWIVSIAIGTLVLLWVLLARTPFPAPGGQQDATANATPGTPAASPVDPRVAALDRRAAALQQRARRVTARRDARWATYRRDLRERNAANAALAVPSTTYIPASTSGGSTGSYSSPISTTSTPSAPPTTTTASS